MLKKNIVLIGMMAAGKTTIGFKLAKKIKYNFVDIDSKIEQSENQKIVDIFQNKGEIYFRKLEEKITLSFLEKTKTVISIGGGAFLNDKIRKKIKKNSISFWLNWKNNVILSRISNSRKRPILDFLDEKEIIKLINSRAKIYLKANYKISCDNLNKFQVTKKILKIYENQKNFS